MFSRFKSKHHFLSSFRKLCQLTLSSKHTGLIFIYRTTLFSDWYSNNIIVILFLRWYLYWKPGSIIIFQKWSFFKINDSDIFKFSVLEIRQVFVKQKPVRNTVGGRGPKILIWRCYNTRQDKIPFVFFDFSYYLNNPLIYIKN